MSYARRVVVTGLGLVTPLGVGVPHNWIEITAGKVATTALTDTRYSKVGSPEFCPYNILKLT